MGVAERWRKGCEWTLGEHETSGRRPRPLPKDASFVKMGCMISFGEACQIFAGQQSDRFEAAAEAVVARARAGMGIDEAARLARAIAQSGESIKLPATLRPFGDVPSTGGPGSLSTLLCPLLIAAHNVRVPKLSAPSLTGGAIDTLALIDGYRSTVSASDDFIGILQRCGLAHSQQTRALCPADAVLFDVRRRMNAVNIPHLIAASLLAKKLVVHGTVAAFDFRVGRSGNVGDTVEAATQTAQVFIATAQAVGVPVTPVLTNNMTFPSTAMGRLEMLHLLNELLRGHPSNTVDAEHVRTCLTLASHAIALCHAGRNPSAITRELTLLLQQGEVHRLFLRHIEAQGGTSEALDQALRDREHCKLIVVRSTGTGFWQPEDLNDLKQWFIDTQRKLAGSSAVPESKQQLGVRLGVAPGTFVKTGDAVAEIRLPHSDIPIGRGEKLLRGKLSSTPFEATPGVLAVLNS